MPGFATADRGWIRAGLLYFAIVFAAGFIFGAIRELLLVPRFGQRYAELIEAPFMLAVIFLTARWLARGELSGEPAVEKLKTGFFALALLLIAEVSVVLTLRGLTIPEYIAQRDPLAGAAYMVMLLIFALAPARRY